MKMNNRTSREHRGRRRASAHSLVIGTAAMAGLLVVGAIASFVGGGSGMIPVAHAAGGKLKSRTRVAPDRYVYYPGTGELRPDEAWSVGGPTPPPAPLTDGSVPDPLSNTMKGGAWNPETEDAQRELVEAFDKKYSLR